MRPRAAAAAAPPVPADLVPVLDAAARYVLEYEQSFRDLAADETYTQWAAAGDTINKGLALSCPSQLCRVSTRADLVFVRLPGPVPWGSYRDVYEVDGRKVRDHEARLEALFGRLPSATAQERARLLLAEGSRYNIGPAIRTVNFPTLALAFLHPANQGRFAWSRGGRRRIDGIESVEVQFDEVARPTIVDRGRDGDLPASGRFWIDPARGTVIRSEVAFRFELDRVLCARASISVDYSAQPALAMWVPSEMHESYEDLAGAPMAVFRSPSRATARYAGFRRFTVSTDVDARVPDAPPTTP